jgi:DNA-nicking Smr family endonuclease
MKSRKSSFIFTSFEDLKVSLENRSISLPKRDDSHRPDHRDQQSSESGQELFRKAMEGVRPMSGDSRVERIWRIELPEGRQNKEDAEALKKLTDLVKHGKGFDISETPEYVEGTGYHVHSSVARRLHQGDYSIQAHIDLHGLGVDDAKEIFEEFLKWAVTNGKRGVLVTHGRGLSSPSEPVLKKKVVDWLTRGSWRKWVIAYSSARPCDGGAGATYILLRQRPVSKRLKIGRRNKPPVYKRRG